MTGTAEQGTVGNGTVGQGWAPAYRMPVEYGPAPGPRNVPGDVPLPRGPERRTGVAFTVPVHASDVAPLVPPGLVLREATMTVTVQSLANLHWLAGRGYSIVSVTLPVAWTAGDGTERAGEFLSVLWENLPEPVITGREELGFPKLFADIDVSPYAAGGTVTARAGWDGTTFLRAETGPLSPAAAPSGPRLPTVTRRYLPGLGRSGAGAVDQLTVTDPDLRLEARVTEVAEGGGAFEFHEVSWAQLPTQYRVVNALAAVRSTGPATVRVACVEGTFSAVRVVPLDPTGRDQQAP